MTPAAVAATSICNEITAANLVLESLNYMKKDVIAMKYWVPEVT